MASFQADSCASQTMYRETDRQTQEGQTHLGGKGERGTSGGSVRTYMYV